MIYYPICPGCGREATHRPVDVLDGRHRIYVKHDHPCDVQRYVACLGPEGQYDAEPLDGRRFEDWADDAA